MRVAYRVTKIEFSRWKTHGEYAILTIDFPDFSLMEGRLPLHYDDYLALKPVVGGTIIIEIPEPKAEGTVIDAPQRAQTAETSFTDDKLFMELFDKMAKPIENRPDQGCVDEQALVQELVSTGNFNESSANDQIRKMMRQGFIYEIEPGLYTK